MPRPDAKGRRFLMGHDARLAKMPDKPTLIDFYRLRFGPSMHMLQSARLALKSGAPEKVVVACLLHDIAITGFIRSDHGYWAAQLVEPYVDEEVSWAIRYHQALRFYPDESVGYQYPELYKTLFGEDYQPEPHIARAYQAAREHKWYMTSRLITVNDLYSFDPNVTVQLDEFTDIIGRNFKQPKEGLGFDASPSAHMWRTINWPTRYL
jgi:HD domain